MAKYESFREGLRVDSRYWNFDTKEELRKLLTNGGYHHIKEKGVSYNAEATDKQVDFAWSYLKKSKVTQQIIDDFIVHTYNKRIVKRALKNQTINGKKYRKGQFIPKDR